MTGYVLSILGVVLAGVMIDIIMPSGTINKYIKSLYGIFVLAVIISPAIKFLSKNQDFDLNYVEYEVNQSLLNYINNQKVVEMTNKIKLDLKNGGFYDIDIKLNYSTSDNILTINSCEANLKKLSISSDKQHINKYEFITGVVHKHTNLTEEVIIFHE